MSYNIHEEFIDSNNSFIERMAKMSMEDVKNEKDRDEAIKLYIQDKTKVAKTLGLDYDKKYYEKQIAKFIRELAEENNPLLGTRQIKADGGSLVGNQEKIDANKDGKITGEDFKLLQKQEGGSIDDQMQMAMGMNQEPEMMPDEEMEDNYLDFIVDEALSEEEEDMLMSKLEQDEQLSMLFDKVLEVASEFAGSGPVDGPGSGVSDSIPARLSDGEFVFTAKATEEIGADELMRMMKDAEANADKRQQVAMGGILDSGEEEIDSNVNRQQVTNEGTYVPEEDTTVRDKIRETMLDPSAQSRYVRS